MVFYGKDCKKKELGGGVSRRILAYDERIMAVEVSFEKGAVGATHSHTHGQISYVISGKFEYTEGGITSVISTGDSYVVAGGVPHGVVCLEEGVLLDVFTPMREDFIEKK
ncbi:MAG: cupin domain-containing protein [Clostridia bacterium]|nr:cupin domain-containing protein [Clostridia bacterium]